MSTHTPRIVLVITTVLYPDYGLGVGVHGGGDTLDQRHALYRENIAHNVNLISGLGIEVVVVENSAAARGLKHTVLDGLGTKVLYTNSSSMKLNCVARWKGLRETRDLKLACLAIGCNDDDIVIKLTGLYRLSDNSFFEAVRSTIGQYDVAYKQCPDYKIVLGLIAMRYGFLKNAITKGPSDVRFCPEAMYADDISNTVPESRILVVDKLGLIRRYSGVAEPEYL